MARLFDWLNDPQRQAKIIGARLNAEFDGIYSEFRTVLSADTAFYVATTGSDSNTGLSAASPFLTLHTATAHVMNNVDFSGFTVTINVADGTYNFAGSCHLGTLTGPGECHIVGNTSTPANVVINGRFYCDGFRPFGWNIEGMKIANSGGICIDVDGGWLKGGLIEWGDCTSAHVFIHNHGVYYCNQNDTISGDATQHWSIQSHSFLRHRGTTLTLTGAPIPNFSQEFIEVGEGCAAQVDGITFSGTATGKRFDIYSGGQIFTDGTDLLTYFPGNAAGTFRGGFYDGQLGGTIMTLTDGITAPSTQAGYALIYVDTADGDLKIKFGDGTVKTIVVDT